MNKKYIVCLITCTNKGTPQSEITAFNYSLGIREITGGVGFMHPYYIGEVNEFAGLKDGVVLDYTPKGPENCAPNSSPNGFGEITYPSD